MTITESKYNIYPYRSEFNHILEYKVSTLFEVNRIVSNIAKSDNYRILNVNISNDDDKYILILSLSSYDPEPIKMIELEKGFRR